MAAVCLICGEAVAWVTQHMRKLEATVQRGHIEARFRSLVQHSSDIIAIVDRSGTFEYVSPSVGRVLQRNPDDLIGMSVLALLHPEDVAPARLFLDALITADPSSAVEWRLRLGSGWCHLETIATNLLQDPDVHGIVLNSRNITERKALEEQLAHRAFHDGLTGCPTEPSSTIASGMR